MAAAKASLAKYAEVKGSLCDELGGHAVMPCCAEMLPVPKVMAEAMSAGVAVLMKVDGGAWTTAVADFAAPTGFTPIVVCVASAGDTDASTEHCCSGAAATGAAATRACKQPALTDVGGKEADGPWAC